MNLQMKIIVILELEKEEQSKLTVSQRKEIINIRAEINNIKSRKTIQSIKPNLILLKDQQNLQTFTYGEKREKTDSTKIKNEGGTIFPIL